MPPSQQQPHGANVFHWKREHTARSFQQARVSLVRDDVHRWLAALSIGSCVALQQWDLLQTALVAAAVCYCGWCGMEASTDQWKRLNFDVTLGTYFSSVIIWLAAGVMASTVVLCFGLFPEGNISERAIMTATVALGVGAQPILNNFAAGLLLVLFRPFRIKDSVTACGHTFEVKSISAFFTYGRSMPANLHLALPNQKLLGDVLANWSAHDIVVCDVSVGVRSGRWPCARIREALDAAVDAYVAGLPEQLMDAGLEEAQAATLARPKVFGPTSIDADKGMQWLVKLRIPEAAVLRAKSLCYGCVHDSLLERGIAFCERPCSEELRQGQ